MADVRIRTLDTDTHSKLRMEAFKRKITMEKLLNEIIVGYFKSADEIK